MNSSLDDPHGRRTFGLAKILGVCALSLGLVVVVARSYKMEEGAGPGIPMSDRDSGGAESRYRTHFAEPDYPGVATSTSRIKIPIPAQAAINSGRKMYSCRLIGPDGLDLEGVPTTIAASGRVFVLEDHGAIPQLILHDLRGEKFSVQIGSHLGADINLDTEGKFPEIVELRASVQSGFLIEVLQGNALAMDVAEKLFVEIEVDGDFRPVEWIRGPRDDVFTQADSVPRFCLLALGGIALAGPHKFFAFDVGASTTGIVDFPYSAANVGWARIELNLSWEPATLRVVSSARIVLAVTGATTGARS